MRGRPVDISLDTAKRLSIAKQHLAGARPKNPGPAAIMGLMHDLRYIQLDPTATVAPSHLLVLWSRLGKFREADLDTLQWKERKLFEGWAHRASVVLTEDYPLYLRRMKSFLDGEGLWDVRLREWMKDNAELRESVLKELRQRGPLPSRAFEDTSKSGWTRARRRWGLRPSGWSSGRDVSRMLEFLFHLGEIMVAGRQGRQKLWDVSEHFLPAWAPKAELTDDEVEYQGAQKSLRALGVATPKQMAWHFLIGRYPHMTKTLTTLQEEGEVVPARLSGIKSKTPWFIHADDVELAEAIADGDWEPRTTLLSPFDNLIIDRDRTHFLFDYFFRIEIYTPKARRKHGFFVMSILDGDRLVGRLDPVFDRRAERLVVNALHAEERVVGGKAQASRIAAAVDDLADFLGAKQVVYAGKVPAVWKGYLR